MKDEAHCPLITLILLSFVLIASCGETGDASAVDSTAVSRADSVPFPELDKAERFIRVSHIFMPSDSAGEAQVLSTMRSIRSDIISGEAAFEEMAREYSLCSSAERGGELPPFSQGGIDWKLDSTARTLQPGELSPVIISRFGIHILKRLED